MPLLGLDGAASTGLEYQQKEDRTEVRVESLPCDAMLKHSAEQVDCFERSDLLTVTSTGSP